MAYGIRLLAWGERALYSRPEYKSERVSYPVMTPSAARGLLEAIHWKPAIRWHIDRIRVLKPIRYESLRRNEVGGKASTANAKIAMKTGSTAGLALLVDEDRQQRAATILRDVAYVIEAHFEMTSRAGAEETAAKHLDIVNRRARKGQHFHAPCLGTREFPAAFRLLEVDEPNPPADPSLAGEQDLGLILHDIDFGAGACPKFFHARMRDGVIEVPVWRAQGGAT